MLIWAVPQRVVGPWFTRYTQALMTAGPGRASTGIRTGLVKPPPPSGEAGPNSASFEFCAKEIWYCCDGSKPRPVTITFRWPGCGFVSATDTERAAAVGVG